MPKSLTVPTPTMLGCVALSVLRRVLSTMTNMSLAATLSCAALASSTRIARIPTTLACFPCANLVNVPPLTTAISLIPTISVVKVNATVKVFWSAAMVRRSPLANLTLKSKKFATVGITIATERSITELLALKTPTLAPFMFVLVVNALLRMWSALLAMTCASSLSALTVLAVVSKTSLALELLLLVSNSSAPLELAALSHSSVLMMMTTSVPFTTASMLRARTFVSKRLATVPMMMMIVLFMSAKITNVKNKTFVTDLSLLLLRRTLLLLMFPLLVPCLILLNLCLLLRTFLLKLVAPPALLPVPLPSLVREMLIPSLSEAARPELSLFWD